MNNLEVRKLKAFSTQIQTAACRDLHLLKIIEDTLDALDGRCNVLQQMNLAADHFIKKLSESELPPANDDLDLAQMFEDTRDLVAQAYERWTQKHICAVNAPELDDEDGVVEAYALLLTEVAALHDKLNTLAWIIREQEADQDKEIPGTFNSAEALFADMGV